MHSTLETSGKTAMVKDEWAQLLRLQRQNIEMERPRRRRWLQRLRRIRRSRLVGEAAARAERRMHGKRMADLDGEFDVDAPDLVNRVLMIFMMPPCVVKFKDHSGASPKTALGMCRFGVLRRSLNSPVGSVAAPEGLWRGPTGRRRQGRSAMTSTRIRVVGSKHVVVPLM